MVPTREKILNFGLSENFKNFGLVHIGPLKYVFQQISQIYRKTAVLESLFNKKMGLSPPTLSKRDSNTAVFL